MGKAVSILIAEPPEAAFFHRPIETGIPVAVEQISAPSAEPGLVAGDDHGLFVADGGEQGGEYQGIGFGVDFGADNQVAAKIGGGLLAARRFGCPYLIIGGQVAVQPFRRGFGLAVAFFGEAALQIGRAVFGIGVPP